MKPSCKLLSFYSNYGFLCWSYLVYLNFSFYRVLLTDKWQSSRLIFSLAQISVKWKAFSRDNFLWPFLQGGHKISLNNIKFNHLIKIKRDCKKQNKLIISAITTPQPHPDETKFSWKTIWLSWIIPYFYVAVVSRWSARPGTRTHSQSTWLKESINCLIPVYEQELKIIGWESCYTGVFVVFKAQWSYLFYLFIIFFSIYVRYQLLTYF